MGIEARAPDGRVWHVSREFPWPSWRKTEDILDGRPGDYLPDFGLAATESLVYGAIAFVGFIVFALVIAFFLPLILFVAEAVIVLIGVALFFRPWRVVAQTSDPPAERLQWRVKGWRRSKRAVAEVARELAAGAPAAPSDSD